MRVGDSSVAGAKFSVPTGRVKTSDGGDKAVALAEDSQMDSGRGLPDGQWCILSPRSRSHGIEASMK
ncbi:hypothetical protein E2562_023073 [Oryza meyeriana var. granulata]|uniref:Uncharacterized protein n=1 Tax=Oryza meyeriana var. granulata TaxID=110450 RepID=A0A6G1EP25_9ORYZ|nr:hypothetical protein E2562_023073 [Oryza meyeriana var. granulata]